jgi:hypothetical protein
MRLILAGTLAIFTLAAAFTFFRPLLKPDSQSFGEHTNAAICMFIGLAAIAIYTAIETAARRILKAIAQHARDVSAELRAQQPPGAGVMTPSTLGPPR